VRGLIVVVVEAFLFLVITSIVVFLTLYIYPKYL
jgi:hypothetical protein